MWFLYEGFYCIHSDQFYCLVKTFKFPILQYIFSQYLGNNGNKTIIVICIDYLLVQKIISKINSLINLV